MRTTVTLPDAILKAAKRRAAERGMTLSAIVEDALRVQLSEKKAPRRKKFKLITFGHGGVRPGVNLDKISALLEEDDIRAYGDRRGGR